jgi:hypothetical protein
MLIPICLLLVLAAGDLLWGIRTGLDRSRR